MGSVETAASAGELLRTLRATHPELEPTTPEALFTEAVLLGREKTESEGGGKFACPSGMFS